MKQVQAVKQLLKSYANTPKVDGVKLFGKGIKVTLGHYCCALATKVQSEAYYSATDSAGIAFPNRLSVNYDKGKVTIPSTSFGFNSEGVHQQIQNNQLFGEPSFSGGKCLYVAKLKLVSKGYFQGGEGASQFEDSFGQTLPEVRAVGLFLADQSQGKVFRVALPKNVVPCFPKLSGDELYFHFYEQAYFRRGLVHCFNRPTKIAKIRSEGLVLQQVTAKEELAVHSSLEIVSEKEYECNYFPQPSPKGTRVLYFSGRIKAQHVFQLRLMSYDPATGLRTEIIPVIRQNRNAEGQQQFNGLAGYFQSFRVEWLDQDSVILNTYFCNQFGIFKVDLANKLVSRMSPSVTKADTWRIAQFDPSSKMLVASLSNLHQNSIHCLRPGQSFTEVYKSQWFGPELVVEQGFIPIPFIKAYLTSPEFGNLEERPVVVQMHGGPHGSLSGELTPLRYCLLKLGFVLLITNQSGSIGFGQQFSQCILGKMTEKTPQQIVSLVEKQKCSGRAILLGGSYGGYLAGILGGRHAEHFRAAILLNPVLDLPFMLKSTDIPEWCLAQSLGQLSDRLAVSAEETARLVQDSPSYSPLRLPGLVMVGAKDLRVPSRAAVAYVASCRQLGSDVSLINYPEEGHQLGKDIAVLLDMTVKIALFCLQHKSKEN